MKKNKKVEKKPKKIIKAIFLITILFILAVVSYSIYLTSQERKGNNTIIAIKEITENEQTQKITYTIKIKDYNIESAIKEIKFETEEQAQAEYYKYEILNKYERREIGEELKGKKLILTMPENQLLQDIECNTNRKLIITESGEEVEIIDQQELKDSLKKQGYTIK